MPVPRYSPANDLINYVPYFPLTPMSIVDAMFFLEAPFWGQKGGSKGQNSPSFRAFLCNINWLAWSDPNCPIAIQLQLEYYATSYDPEDDIRLDSFHGEQSC